MKPSHVFMTADAVGGVWTYALDLARGLAGRGVRTTLAVLGPAPEAEQRRAAEAVPGLHLIHADFPLEWLALSGAVVEASGAAVAAMANHSGADLVHLNTPALGSEGGFAAPVLAAAHSDVATWWRAVKDGPMPDDFGWRSALVRRGYFNAQAVIAPSAAFAAATQAAYDLSAPPLVVHNGRSHEGAPGPGMADRVFTAGRMWDEGKGMAVLDRAAGRIASLVVAAGPLAGPHGQSIRFQHLRALGRVDEAEMDRRLAGRPVFVSPSLYEPFGLAVLEAAQAGCPLVLSDIPTFRELWDGAAVFTPPGDDRALADALQSVMLDPELRRALGAAALDRAGRYTIDATVARTAEIYCALLAGGQAAAA